MQNAGAPKAIGVGQRTDLPVPPNATVTASCYYKVARATTLLQWMISTTASPRFGASEFLERRERLPVGEWRRAVVSFTNGTGVTQRITGVSVSSNGFTGDVLLDNFQLELAMEANAYTARTPTLAELTAESESRSTRLRFQLPAQTQKLQGTTAGRRRVRSAHRSRLPVAPGRQRQPLVGPSADGVRLRRRPLLTPLLALPPSSESRSRRSSWSCAWTRRKATRMAGWARWR